MSDVFADGFVTVYAKSTGRKQRVPEHYLGHPVLGRDFDLTPSARAAAEQPSEQPSEPGGQETALLKQPDDTWTRAQLDEHAAALGIDTSDLPNKAAVLDAIAGQPADEEPAEELADEPADHQTSDDNPSSDQPPAAGENQE